MALAGLEPQERKATDATADASTDAAQATDTTMLCRLEMLGLALCCVMLFSPCVP